MVHTDSIVNQLVVCVDSLLLYNQPAQNVWLKTTTIYIARDFMGQLRGSYGLVQLSYPLLASLSIRGKLAGGLETA